MTKTNSMKWTRLAVLALAPALILVTGCVMGGKDGKDGRAGTTGQTGATGDTGDTGERGPARTVIIDRSHARATRDDTSGRFRKEASARTSG